MVVAVTVSCGPTSGSVAINNHAPPGRSSLRNLTTASGLASGALPFAGSLGLMPIAQNLLRVACDSVRPQGLSAHFCGGLSVRHADGYITLRGVKRRAPEATPTRQSNSS